MQQFRRLWQRLPQLAKARTTISALFVSPSDKVEEVLSIELSCIQERHATGKKIFDQLGGLIRTGLTGTNVMDVRVILIR